MATILVIDDEKGIRDVLRTSLELSGYHVLTASNGKDGLACSRDMDIDIVVTDIFMPEHDGFETIMEFKKIIPDIKIVAISGGGYFDPHSALRTAEHLGAHFGFNKPIDLTIFIAKINFLLQS